MHQGDLKLVDVAESRAGGQMDWSMLALSSLVQPCRHLHAQGSYSQNVGVAEFPRVKVAIRRSTAPWKSDRQDPVSVIVGTHSGHNLPSRRKL